MGQGGQGEHRDSSLHVILTGQRRGEERALKEKKLVCFDESALTMTLTMETAFHCGHAPCLHPQYHLQHGEIRGLDKFGGLAF